MKSTTSPKQREAARLLAFGHSGAEVCKQVGINPATLFRWKQKPEFDDLHKSLLQRAEDEACLHLHALRSTAVERLAVLLQHQNPTVSLRAAEAILSRTEDRFVPDPFSLLSSPTMAWEEVQRELERIRKLGQCETPETQKTTSA
jgi:hypothetical protein